MTDFKEKMGAKETDQMVRLLFNRSLAKLSAVLKTTDKNRKHKNQ
jgi:hypothetical protein